MALVAAGCAQLPGRPAPVEVPASVTLPETFNVAGRLSVRRGDQGLSASFTWEHLPGSDRIDLTTPLGQTVARLESESGRVRLTAAEGRTDEAPTWEALTERGLGIPLPVSGLRYWIHAAPRPGAPFAAERSDSGRIDVLRQEGWEIVFRYREPDAARPASLRASFHDLDLRIAIDRWE